MTTPIETINKLQREGTRTFTAKSAQGFMDNVKSVMSSPTTRDIALKGLVGAGIGGVGLGAARAMRGDKDKKERARGIVSSALMGAIMGGTAGVSYGATQRMGWKRPSLDKDDIEKVPNWWSRHKGRVTGTGIGGGLSAGSWLRGRPDRIVPKPVEKAIGERIVTSARTGRSPVPYAKKLIGGVDDVAKATTTMGGRLKNLSHLGYIPAGYFGGSIVDEFNNYPALRQDVYKKLLSQETDYMRALRYLKAGDKTKAQAILDEIQRRIPRAAEGL